MVDGAAVQGHTPSMVGGVGQRLGEAVGQAEGRLGAPTTPTTVVSQTEAKSGKNSCDSLPNGQGSLGQGSSWKSGWTDESGFPDSLQGPGPAEYSFPDDLRMQTTVCSKVSVGSQTEGRYAVSPVCQRKRDRKRKKTSSMGEQNVYSGAFYRSRRLTNSNINEARSCKESMAVRSGLTSEVPLPFTGMVLPGTLPFTVFPLVEELARLGFEVSQPIDSSEQFNDSGVGFEGEGPLEGEKPQLQSESIQGRLSHQGDKEGEMPGQGEPEGGEEEDPEAGAGGGAGGGPPHLPRDTCTPPHEAQQPEGAGGGVPGGPLLSPRDRVTPHQPGPQGRAALRLEKLKFLAKILLEWRELLKKLGKLRRVDSGSRKNPEELEQLKKSRLHSHHAFLDQAWDMVEGAHLMGWQEAGEKVAVLAQLGEQLCGLHQELSDLRDKLEDNFRDNAGREYREVGEELLRRVRLSCPWPELDEAMGERRAH